MDNKKVVMNVNKSLDSIEKSLSNYLIIQQKNLDIIKLEIEQIKKTLTELDNNKDEIILKKAPRATKKSEVALPDFKKLYKEILEELKESTDGHTSNKLLNFINNNTVKTTQQFCKENGIIVSLSKTPKDKISNKILTAIYDSPRVD
jgi:hypothetical protein